MKKSDCLGYIRDYTAHLYGDYNITIIRITIKTTKFSWQRIQRIPCFRPVTPWRCSGVVLNIRYNKSWLGYNWPLVSCQGRICLTLRQGCLEICMIHIWWVVVSFFLEVSPGSLGKWSNLTDIFQMGGNHQLISLCMYIYTHYVYIYMLCLSVRREGLWPCMSNENDRRWMSMENTFFEAVVAWSCVLKCVDTFKLIQFF